MKATVVLLVVLCTGALGVWACDPPIIIIHSPGDGGTMSGTTTIEMSVASETTVAGVDIYVDDWLLATLTITDSIADVYRYDWDTATVEDGTHNLYARARALKRKDGLTPTVTVTVKN